MARFHQRGTRPLVQTTGSVSLFATDIRRALEQSQWRVKPEIPSGETHPPLETLTIMRTGGEGV